MLIDRRKILAFVHDAGLSYWPHGPTLSDDQNTAKPVDLSKLGRRWVDVELPSKFSHLGIEGRIYVDAAALAEGNGSAFERCDWAVAAFSFLGGLAEQWHEHENGPIHSFASRLNKMPPRCFDFAWANRILLLLRAREADRRGVEELLLFGPMPVSEIMLTHDVDAIDKTFPIRVKQSVFELFNFVRFALKGQIGAASTALKRALRMAFRSPSYDHLDRVADLAKEVGLRAVYHLYANASRRSLKLWLFDPGYSPNDPRLLDFTKRRSAEGFEFGLHPSFDSWADPKSLQKTKTLMESTLSRELNFVRQHWLRFSWEKTWNAQEQAGFIVDSTLGFNDRPGFRTSAALRYRPWDLGRQQVHRIQILPLILMDSQLYSYQSLESDERIKNIRALIREVRSVHGSACVLWHPHTLSNDYQWEQGYRDLLTCLTEDPVRLPTDVL